MKQQEEEMLDLKFVRENPEIVKQNIKNKFQDSKLGLVDEVIELELRTEPLRKRPMICAPIRIKLQNRSAP